MAGMATVTDDDDEMPRHPRDAMGMLILVTGILCALLLMLGAFGLA
jgi:hypothetical protein